jgi:glycosyltransferase involved in cell wall biosynthesis
VLVESIQVKNLPPAIALGPSVGYEKQAAIQAIKAGIPNTGPVDGPSPGLVSVIIPVKDTQRYLRTCLNSVLGQSHALLDVIAVDDGSRDGSLGILKEFAARDSRIRVLTQDNLGPGAARNIGVASAIGQWICFVDSDDYLHPRYVERLLKAAQECDADVSFCCAVVFDDSNGKTIDSASTFHSIVFPVSFDGNGFDAASYPHKNDLFSINLGPWAKLLNAKLARTIKFPENVRRFEDNPFSYGALFKAQHVAWIREQLYYHRQRKESTMGRVRNGELPAATLEDFMEVRRLCLELFSRDPELASLYERRSSDELWSFFLKLPRELRIEYAEKVRQALGREASRLFGSNRQALRIASYFAPYGLVILGHRLVDSLRATRGN